MTIRNVPERFGPAPIRFALGLVLAVHGAGKVLNAGPAASGMAGFVDSVAGLGLPFPGLLAWVAALVELAGGLLLLLGLLTRFVALLAAIEMAVATLGVHLGNGFLVSEGGFEFTLVLALAALSLVLTGPGSPSLDRDLLDGRLDPLVRSRSSGPVRS